MGFDLLLDRVMMVGMGSWSVPGRPSSPVVAAAGGARLLEPRISGSPALSCGSMSPVRLCFLPWLRAPSEFVELPLACSILFELWDVFPVVLISEFASTNPDFVCHLD